MTHYTPYQTKLLELLSDGKPHTKVEMIRHLDPSETMSNQSFYSTIFRLRQVMPSSDMILCVWVNRRPMYQHVRRIVRAND